MGPSEPTSTDSNHFVSVRFDLTHGALWCREASGESVHLALRTNHGVVVYAVRPGGLADENECRRLLEQTKYGPLLEEMKTKLANGVSVTFVPTHYDQPHGLTKRVETSRKVMDWERIVGLVGAHARTWIYTSDEHRDALKQCNLVPLLIAGDLTTLALVTITLQPSGTIRYVSFREPAGEQREPRPWWKVW